MANVTVSVSAETIFTCTYNNVSDSCIVTVQTHLFAPALDGTEQITTLSGSTTVANGEMSGGTSYLTTGWDNSIDWELTFEAYYTGRDGEAIILPFDNPNKRDYKSLAFMPPAYNNVYSNMENSRQTDGNLNSVTQSSWLQFKVTRVGNTISVQIGNNTKTTHTYRFSSYGMVSIGVDTWGNVAKLRNIIVDAL